MCGVMYTGMLTRHRPVFFIDSHYACKHQWSHRLGRSRSHYLNSNLNQNNTSESLIIILKFRGTNSSSGSPLAYMPPRLCFGSHVPIHTSL